MMLEQTSVLFLQEGFQRPRDKETEHIRHVDEKEYKQWIHFGMNSEKHNHLRAAVDIFDTCMLQLTWKTEETNVKNASTTQTVFLLNASARRAQSSVLRATKIG